MTGDYVVIIIYLLTVGKPRQALLNKLKGRFDSVVSQSK
jgi:hypothetical protein